MSATEYGTLRRTFRVWNQFYICCAFEDQLPLILLYYQKCALLCWYIITSKFAAPLECGTLSFFSGSNAQRWSHRSGRFRRNIKITQKNVEYYQTSVKNDNTKRAKYKELSFAKRNTRNLSPSKNGRKEPKSRCTFIAVYELRIIKAISDSQSQNGMKFWIWIKQKTLYGIHQTQIGKSTRK